jgi:KDO2-lipid IV(A) lauroyltransferase
MLFLPVLGTAWFTPYSVQRWLARTTARFVYVLAPRLRRRLLHNQRMVQPDASEEEIRRSALSVLRHYGYYLLDFFSLRLGLRKDILRRSATPRSFEQLQQNGRGVIFATAHIGSWEIAGFALAMRGAEAAMVSDAEEIGYLGSLRSRIRQRLQHDEVLLQEGPHASIDLLHRLRSGGLVGLQMDRGGQGTGMQSVPFLKGHLKMPRGPARLAVLTNACILPVFALFNEEGTYDLMAEPAIDPKGLREEEILQRLAGILESYVQRYPDQWLMMQNPWATESEATAGARAS